MIGKERFLLNVPKIVAGWRLIAKGGACDEPLGRTSRGHERWWIDASTDQDIATYQQVGERVIFTVLMTDGRPRVSVVKTEEIIPNEWEPISTTTLPLAQVEQSYIENILLDWMT